MMINDSLNTFVYYKNNLPHFQHKDSPIFITWRLSFPFPTSFTDKCNEKRKLHDSSMKIASDEEKQELKYKFDKQIFDLYDTFLASDLSFPRLLTKPELIDIVKYVLHFGDEKDYELLCYCIMSNHVHVLIKPLPDNNKKYKLINQITRNWKGVSARMINRTLSMSGSIWQIESYDHVVRNEKEFNNIVMYILNNPVKAGLIEDWRDWTGSYVSEKVISK